MQIDVEEIPQSGLHLSFEISQEGDVFKERGFFLAGPAQVALDVHRHQGEEVYVQGCVDATLVSECDRCLKSYGHPVSTDFYFDFVPIPESAGRSGMGESDLQDIDNLPSLYKGNQIEIDGEIADQLLLALPMRLLCTTDCQGLCSQCGTDLNNAKCACPVLSDFCWAGLKSFQMKEPNAKSKT